MRNLLGKKRIEHLERQNRSRRQELGRGRARARGLVRQGRALRKQAPGFFAGLRGRVTEAAGAFVDGGEPHDVSGWDAERWREWWPFVPEAEGPESAAAAMPCRVRVGALVGGGGQQKFVVPEYGPFIGHGRTVIVRTSSNEHEVGAALLRSLVVRTALLLPHQSEFTLLDPAGNGAAFPMRRHLPLVRPSSGDTRRDLDEVIQHVQHIYGSYLDESFPSFDLIDPHLRLSERFQLVFAADFPNKYDRRAIEALQSVANTGPATGTYTFIHHNADVKLPRDLSMRGFESAAVLDLTSTERPDGLRFEPDSAPRGGLQDLVFERLKQAKPPDRRVDWESVVAIPEEGWWGETAVDLIRSPVGALGAKGTLEVWFGVNAEAPSAHGMLAAMTGAGKSNLYHVLILGLCMRYGPSELRLFLVDGKDGVEFQPYRDLPHAEVVSLNSSPELSRSVLEELVAEKERRNAMFARVKASDYSGYRRLDQPGGELPRILLLVDEYQELFEGDRDGIASAYLRQLAEQGRSAGIHLFLGSQRFGAAGMLHQTAIFGNIHLRMAMQMTASDIDALTEFGRQGKQLIRKCDLPGKLVVNQRSGSDGSSQVGKVAFPTKEEKREVLGAIIRRAAEGPAASTVVFDGKAQPNLIENPQVQTLLRHADWLSEEEMQSFARKPPHDGGLGLPTWFAAEQPHVFWLGQEFSVRGQAALTIRRRAGENVVLVGSANASRYAMLASILASMALNAGPARARFLLIDQAIPGTDWAGTLKACKKKALDRAGYEAELLKTRRQAAEALDRLMAELEARRALPEAELQSLPTLLVAGTELDRVGALCARPDAYGLTPSPAGEQLLKVAIEGPPLGIHLLLSFEGVRALTRVIDERRGLVHFRHRVALQMSEDDSLALVRNRKASQLQTHGPTPVCAVYVDLEKDTRRRFKPYSIDSSPPLEEQLGRIGDVLERRTKDT